MFRIDPGIIHPIIPNHPTGYAVALIPIIQSPCTGTSPVRASQSDEFRMYEFKVKRCPVSRAHDWTVCPWAHPGERARRRDPRRVLYKAVPCEEFRAHQRCRRGDGCEYAHGVFEYWLHPARYRTRACTSGAACTRKVCFFAHAPGELRARTRYPFEPDEGSKTTTTVHVPLEGEVLESAMSKSTRDAMSKSSSERSDLMECEGDDFEMPDVEWIRDLIG